MKKYISLLLILLLCLCGLAACAQTPEVEQTIAPPADANVQAEEETVKENKKFVSHFDCYDDMVICYLAYAGPGPLPYNRTLGAAKLTLNKDKAFIAEGAASMHVQVQMLNRFKTMIYADNFVEKLTDIDGAKRLSIDVYNPTDKEIDFTVEVTTLKGATVLSVKKTCAPNAWTTVDGTFERNVTDSVRLFSMEMVNATDGETFDLYLDNFYLDYAE